MSGLHDVYHLAWLVVSLLWLQAKNASKERNGQKVTQKTKSGNRSPNENSSLIRKRLILESSFAIPSAILV